MVELSKATFQQIHDEMLHRASNYGTCLVSEATDRKKVLDADLKVPYIESASYDLYRAIEWLNKGLLFVRTHDS